MKNSILFISIAALFFLSSCMQENSAVTPASKAATYYGESKAFGGDSIRAFIKTDLDGVVNSIGVSFKQSAFAVLESQNDSMFMMMLPQGINVPANPPWGIDHIEVDWSSKGDPLPPYNVPHFDVHFFAVDMATQMAVLAGMDNLTMMMDTSFVPHGYMMMMDAEAMMGVHAMDTTEHTNPFMHTLMYGFYHGNMYFVEPMASKSYLDSKTNFSADIKQPSAYKKSGFYPTKYYIRYDSQKAEYSISVDNFVSH